MDWNELPFPTPGDLPDPGIEPAFAAPSALAGRFFTTVPPGNYIYIYIYIYIYTHTHTHTYTHTHKIIYL